MSANARNMAANSNAARRVRQPALAERGECATGFPQVAATGEDHLGKRHARVRKQLDRIDAMVREEMDLQKIARLASASAWLSEMERVLDGHPLPGSRRPGQDKPKPLFTSCLPDPT